MPEVYLKNVTARRREVLNSRPARGLDLLTICVEAGLSIDAAFRAGRPGDAGLDARTWPPSSS